MWSHKSIAFSQVFQQLSILDLFSFASQLKKVKYSINDYVYQKNEANNGLYLIKQGTGINQARCKYWADC